MLSIDACRSMLNIRACICRVVARSDRIISLANQQASPELASQDSKSIDALIHICYSTSRYYNCFLINGAIA
jgi:hypothetical protein